MVEVTFDDAEMVLTVKGMHKFWALKSELRIPKSHIAGARVNSGEVKNPKGWRAPGTYIPGIITAGTYRAHGEKVFWDVVKKDRSIIIDLKDDEYKQYVIKRKRTIMTQLRQRDPLGSVLIRTLGPELGKTCAIGYT